jgi:hypothetical protein
MKFDGSSGFRPSAEARRYVYAVLGAMLEHELSEARNFNHDGWMFGGIEDEADRRRLTKAINLVRDEMRRKATFTSGAAPLVVPPVKP